MLTPQEVSNHAFAKSTFGGYNMAMVDEFLDAVTTDYAALYNDNQILKNKLKVLSDTVEEYRATDDAMRKTLLAAQKMAESMVSDAETRKAELVEEAEEAARQRINELRAEIAAEEYRLQAAQESTAAYVAELVKLYEGQRDFLTGLAKLTPEVRANEARVTDTVSDIEEAMSQFQTEETSPELNVHPPVASSAILLMAPPTDEESDEDEYEDEEPVESEEMDPLDRLLSELPDAAPASGRFDDLQFGKDYSIE